MFMLMFMFIVEPLPPAPILVDAQGVSSMAILVIWKSVGEKSQQMQNFTIVVELKGTKYFKNYYSIGTEEDKKTERRYSFAFKDLKPSTTYEICVFSTKTKKNKLFSSLLSNCINATTKPGMYVFYILHLILSKQ